MLMMAGMSLVFFVVVFTELFFILYRDAGLMVQEETKNASK